MHGSVTTRLWLARLAMAVPAAIALLTQDHIGRLRMSGSVAAMEITRHEYICSGRAT